MAGRYARRSGRVKVGDARWSDPVLAAVRAMKRPAVIHGGPAVRGLELVSIDDRAAARAVGAVAFAGGNARRW